MSNTPERDGAEQQLASVAEALGIPESTVETTRERLAELRSEPELESKSLPVLGSAILSLTCREDGLPITVGDIADTWTGTMPEGSVEPDQLTSLFGVIASKLNMRGTPSQPRALIERYGKDLGLPDSIIVVANRILVDVFSQDPETIADDTSPDVTAGAILYIAARVNGHDDVNVGEISDIMGTSQFAVQSRSKEFRDMLGKERLANDSRYHLPAGADPEPTEGRATDAGQPSQTSEADGGAADASDADAGDQQAADASDGAADQQAADADEEAAAGDAAGEDAEAAIEEVADANDAADEQADAADGQAEAATDEQADEAADEQADEAADEQAGEAVDGDPDAVEGDVEAVVQSLFPDELPTTETVAAELEGDADTDDVEAALAAAESGGGLQRKSAGSTVVWVPGDDASLTPDLTEDAVEKEIDEIVAALELDASLRVFARGLVSDAVDSLDVENASEMAGAVVLAASRIQDVDVTAAEVAEAGEFESRVLYTWLDELEGTVDLEIPRLGADEFLDRLAEDLDLEDAVREEAQRVLDQFDPADSDDSFTAPELAAGATLLAATVSGGDIDTEDVGAASGTDPEHVTDAMDSILVSLCRSLVSDDLDYEEIDWAPGLLELDLEASFEDADTRAAVALARTYIAGRESEPVDDATIAALLDRDTDEESEADE